MISARTELTPSGPKSGMVTISRFTGDHSSKYDLILLVKLAKYTGFRVYRRSYLIWSPVLPDTWSIMFSKGPYLVLNSIYS